MIRFKKLQQMVAGTCEVCSFAAHMNLHRFGQVVIGTHFQIQKQRHLPKQGVGSDDGDSGDAGFLKAVDAAQHAHRRAAPQCGCGIDALGLRAIPEQQATANKAHAHHDLAGHAHKVLKI